jgi:hypothetical protein
LELVKILIFITVDIFKHTAKKITKIKRADQILPEVYGTNLSTGEVRTEKPQNVPFLNNSLESGVLKVRPIPTNRLRAMNSLAT